MNPVKQREQLADLGVAGLPLAGRLEGLDPQLGGLISPPYAAAQVPVSRSGIPIVTAGWVSAMHARNVRVDVWTIDDPAEMQRLIDLDVDGIFTNRPDVLLALLGR